MNLRRRIERIETTKGPRPVPIYFGPRHGLGVCAGKEITYDQWLERYGERMKAEPGCTAAMIIENEHPPTNDNDEIERTTG